MSKYSIRFKNKNNYKYKILFIFVFLIVLFVYFFSYINLKDDSDSKLDIKPTILLIAGHSYSPQCMSFNDIDDCRGKIKSSNYAEEEETRLFAKSIRKELLDLNINVDIANALMSGDFDKMNKSFYLECKSNSKLCNKFDWSKYKYVLEIHFNSSFNHRISGSCSVVLEGSDVLDIDDELVKDIVDITGNDALEKQELNAFNLKFFKKLGVDMSYLEVEFYDNNEAMRVFKNNQNDIAKKIAESIKKYYG